MIARVSGYKYFGLLTVELTKTVYILLLNIHLVKQSKDREKHSLVKSPGSRA
jgi:hypothetical protein